MATETPKQNPFAGKGVFTANDPSPALELKGLIDWVAVKVDGNDTASPAQIQALKDAGFKIVIWEASPSQTGVNAIKQYGAVGYIAQAELPSEIQQANAIASQINVPKVIVTHSADMLAYYNKNSGYGVMFEYYKNEDPGKNPINAPGFFATALSKGAPFVTLTLGSWDSAKMNISFEEYSRDIAEMKSKGVPLIGVSVYIYNGMNPGQKKNYQDYSRKSSLLGTGSLTTAGTPGGIPPVEHGQGNKPLEQPKHEPGYTLEKMEDKASDIAGAPPAYSKGAPVEKYFETKDKAGRPNTVTVTQSGAVIQQVAGKDPYRIGWVDPSKDFDYGTIKTGKTSPYATGAGIGTHVSAAEAGGAPPVASDQGAVNLDKSFHFEDKIGRANTITVAADGTVYQQVEGWDNPKVIYNPDNHGGAPWPGLENPKIYGDKANISSASKPSGTGMNGTGNSDQLNPASFGAPPVAGPLNQNTNLPTNIDELTNYAKVTGQHEQPLQVFDPGAPGGFKAM